MDNVFQNSNRENSLDYSRKVTQKLHQKARERQQKNEMAKLGVLNRYNSFANSNRLDENMRRSMDEGSIKLLHIEHHDFRDRVKQLEQEKTGGIYLRTQMLGRERTQQEQDIFCENHLERDEYRSDLPTKSIKKWLRVREMAHEGPEMRFGLKKRTENENIVEQINNNSIIDHTEKSMKMVHFPEWKYNYKNQWRKNSTGETVDFYIAPNKFIDTVPWDQHKIVDGREEQYVDGLEAVGFKQTTRFRNKDKEFNRPEFVPYVKDDTWEDTLKCSKSIRTLKGDQTFQIPDNYDLYSTNKKLDGEIRKTLLDTKSVDRLVPFRHSQNINGLDSQDLRPVTEKIYKLSLKHNNISMKPNLTLNFSMNDDNISGAMQRQYSPSLNQSPVPVKYEMNNSQNTNFQSTNQYSTQKATQKGISNERLPKFKYNMDSIESNTNKQASKSRSIDKKSSIKLKNASIHSDSDSPYKKPLYRTQDSESKRHKISLPNIQVKKNFLPWEQPSKVEISQMVNRYFQKKSRHSRRPQGQNNLSNSQINKI